MMSDEARNVFPETTGRIAHARSMSIRPWEDRLVAYRNIGALLAERARQHPDKNWLTFVDENGRKSCFSYGEFFALAGRAAALMRDRLQVDAGDRIATLLVNDPRTVLIYFAAWMIGATVVPVNIGEDDGRVEFILRNAAVKAAFVLPEQVARIEKLRSTLPGPASTVLVDVARPLTTGQGGGAVDAGFRPSPRPSAPIMGDQSSGLRARAVALTPLPQPLSPPGKEDQEEPHPDPLLGKEREPEKGYRPSEVDFDEAIAEFRPLTELPDLAPDTECLIVYTSGTTGAPKGVVLEQYNLLADARSIAEWHRFGPSDRAMCVLPIHHVNGTVVTLMTPLYSGGSVVLNRKFRAQSFWRTLSEEGCTWVSVVPTVLAFLCERRDDLGQFDLSRFRHIICGAGPLTTELAARFHECFGVRVVHGYGLSETTCYSCFLPVDLPEGDYISWMTERGFPSIGCPVPANEMAIHDVDGNPLGENERGEIVIRGHNVMKYYFQRPDANRDCFAHGWFRSGDEGFYQNGPDGRQYYFITGRLKELIIRGGVNYSPFDIDEVLCAIPGIKAAMAVGFENNFYGEEIGAYVQLEKGSTLTAESIIATCREKLPYSKSPKVVVFGETFPVTSTGKYQRLQLRHLFAEWKDAEFREKRG